MTDDKEEFSIDNWNKMWSKGHTPFHREDVNHGLMKYYDKIKNGREKIQIFVPLCGKSVDMKWLSDQGSTVIGVEGSEIAVKEFFAEQNVKYNIVDVPEVNGRLYTSEDKRIRLYCCDFFLFSSKLEGFMDAIWDRASLVAISKDDRTRYAEIMKGLMAPEGQYLLDTLEYDENIYKGPPFHVSGELIMDLFGDRMRITKLEATDVTSEVPERWGLDKVEEVVYLLTPKKSSSL